MSLGDVKDALGRHKKKIFLAMCLSGFLAFAYQGKKELTYTASGLLKINEEKSNDLKQLFSSKSASTQISPFYCSQMMQTAANKLGMQAELTEKGKRSNTTKWINKLRAEWTCLFSRAVKSTHLTRKNPAFARSPIPDNTPSITCTNIEYPDEFCSLLKIRFTNEKEYIVYTGRKNKVGMGTLNHPFQWDGGTFTLSATGHPPLKKKKFVLKLFPKEPCQASLAEKLEIEKVEGDTSLLELTFSHPNRHFAAAVVNQCIQEYFNRLKKEADRNIKGQLAYLNQRKQESQKELASEFVRFTDQTHAHLADSGFVSYKGEAQYINSSQSKALERQLKLATDMCTLDLKLTKEKRPFAQIVEELKVERSLKKEASVLSVASNEKRVQDYNKSLKEKNLFLKAATSFVDNLDHQKLITLTVPLALQDGRLTPAISRLIALQKKLIDQKNYSERERGVVVEAAEVEIAILKEQIENLKKITLDEKEQLVKKVKSVQETLLLAMLEEYEKEGQQLAKLQARARGLPTRLIEEDQLKASTLVQQEIVNSLTQVVEANNLSEYLRPTNANPLLLAQVPTQVNPPHLLLSFCLGAMIAAILYLIALVLMQAIRGPRATPENLRQVGFKTVGRVSGHLGALKERDRKALTQLAHHLHEARVVVVHQQKAASILPSLKKLFSDVDPDGSYLEIEVNQKSELLVCSKDFQEKLSTTDAKVLVACCCAANSLAMQTLAELADRVVFVVDEEQLETFSYVDRKKGLFIFQPHSLATTDPLSLFSLRRINSLLSSRWKFLQNS